MRRLQLMMIISAIGLLSFAGCESGGAMPARMRERFQAPEPKAQIFEADQREVFEAAQAAMRLLDFQITRARMAQGILNAHSRLHASDSFGKARQYVMEVLIRSYEPGKTDVSVILREQEESASFAGATDLVLREHALYESFFAALEQVLRERSGSAGESIKSQ